MKSKTAVYTVFAFLVASLLQPLPLKSEETSLYLTVQIENLPALDVPFVPTPQEVVDQMLSIASVNSSDILYDLGCGDGRVVVTAAKKRHVRRAVGFDIDPDRIRESTENARKAGVSDQVAFHEKNLFDVDYREATVMTLYLLPSVNLKLRPRLLNELKPGSRIVSHDFDMGEWNPDRQVSLGEHRIYFWVVPANINGTWSWNLSGRGQSQQYELHLEQQFQNVTVAELLVNGVPRRVGSMRLEGDRLEFAVQLNTDGRKQQVSFSGRVKGDSLDGTLAASGDAGKKKWSARRVPNTAIPIDIRNDEQIHL